MRIVKSADKTTSQSRRLTSHGNHAEKMLLGGRGALIRWNAKTVKVTGEKPNSNNGDKRP